jgi:hypothetical protein
MRSEVSGGACGLSKLASAASASFSAAPKQMSDKTGKVPARPDNLFRAVPITFFNDLRPTRYLSLTYLLARVVFSLRRCFTMQIAA